MSLEARETLPNLHRSPIYRVCDVISTTVSDGVDEECTCACIKAEVGAVEANCGEPQSQIPDLRRCTIAVETNVTK